MKRVICLLLLSATPVLAQNPTLDLYGSYIRQVQPLIEEQLRSVEGRGGAAAVGSLTGCGYTPVEGSRTCWCYGRPCIAQACATVDTSVDNSLWSHATDFSVILSRYRSYLLPPDGLIPVGQGYGLEADKAALMLQAQALQGTFGRENQRACIPTFGEVVDAWFTIFNHCQHEWYSPVSQCKVKAPTVEGCRVGPLYGSCDPCSTPVFGTPPVEHECDVYYDDPSDLSTWHCGGCGPLSTTIVVRCNRARMALCKDKKEGIGLDLNSCKLYRELGIAIGCAE